MRLRWLVTKYVAKTWGGPRVYRKTYRLQCSDEDGPWLDIPVVTISSGDWERSEMEQHEAAKGNRFEIAIKP